MSKQWIWKCLFLLSIGIPSLVRAEPTQDSPTSFDPALARKLMKKLESGEASTRRTAVEALASLGTQVLPTLLDGLYSSSPRVQSGALSALRGMGPKTTYALMRMLHHNKDKLSAQSMLALHYLCPQASDHLVRRLKEPSTHPRHLANYALKKLELNAARSLLRGLKHKSRLVRLESAGLIGKIADKLDNPRFAPPRPPQTRGKRNNIPKSDEVLKALVLLLRDSDKSIRQTTIWAIGRMGPRAKSATNKLRPMLRDRVADVRKTTLWTMGQIGPSVQKVALKDIAKRLYDQEVDVRDMAGKTLLRVEDVLEPRANNYAFEMLQRDIQSRRWRRRARGARGLGGMAPFQKVHKALRKLATTDTVAKVREEALRALQKHLEFAVPVLRMGLQDRSLRVREASARTLGKLGALAVPARPYLQQLTTYKTTASSRRKKRAAKALRATSKQALAQIAAHEQALQRTGAQAKGLVQLPRMERLKRIAPSTPTPQPRRIASDSRSNTTPQATTAQPIARTPPQVATRTQIPQSHVRAVPSSPSSQLKTRTARLLQELSSGSRITRRRARRELPSLPPNAIVYLREALKQGKDKEREAAALALGLLGPRAIMASQELSQALYDKRWQVRRVAATSLGQMGPMAANTIPALIQAKQDKRRAVRQAADRAILAMGDDAILQQSQQYGTQNSQFIPYLTQLLQSKRWQVRQQAAQQLEKFAAQARSATQALVKASADRRPKVQLAALKALRTVARPSRFLRRALQKRSRAQNPEVRSLALQLVGQFAPRDGTVLKTLRRALRDRAAEVRKGAAIAIGQRGPSANAAQPDLLRRCREDKSSTVRLAALNALVQVSTPKTAISTIQGLLLKDASAAVRQRIAYHLARFGVQAQTALPTLRQAQKDKDRQVRLAVENAIRSISRSQESTLQQLQQSLSHPSWRIRAAAVTGIGVQGARSQRYLRRLFQLLRQEPHPEVRIAILYALVRIAPNDAEVLPVLINALNDKAPVVRRGAAQAISQLGPLAAAATPALSQRLQDKDRSVQQAAVIALGKFGKDAQGELSALRQLLQRSKDAKLRQSIQRSIQQIQSVP